MSQDIKSKAIELRSSYGLKLPDAIIAATGILYNLPIVTADKGFSRIKELDLVLINV